MLKQRLMTALLLGPLLLIALFWGSATLLAVLLTAILTIAAYEWSSLIPVKAVWTYLYVLAQLFFLYLCGQFFELYLGVGLILWIGAIAAILFYPSSMSYWGYPLLVACVGLWFLPLFGQSLKLIYLLPEGRFYLFILLLLIWSADVGAYFSGRQFGQRKLLYAVSPGKTWEGALGGLILALFVVLLAAYFFNLLTSSWLWVLWILLLVPVSIFGDLFISMLKRRVHLKDTGALLPGHGGILDRFDSLIAAAPFYYLALSLSLRSFS